MRPEELVRGADEEVGVECGNVDGHVRRSVNGIDICPRPDVVRHLHDARDRIDRPDRVGCHGDGHDAGARSKGLLEVRHVQSAILPDPDPTDGYAALLL